MSGPKRLRRTRSWGVSRVTVATLLLVAGCTPPPPPEPLGACDLVVDVTGHPGAEWSMDTIQAGAERLKAACPDRALTGHLITDYSKANQCPKPFVNSNPGDIKNDSKKERVRQEAWQTYGQQLEQMVNCGVYGPDGDPANGEVKLEGTDVFSAVQAAAETLDGLPAPHTVYFISDMRNTMPPMKTPPKGSVSDAIDELEESGAIPDLAGADVIVVGTGSSDSLTPKQNAKLVSFWEDYFAIANAGSVSFRQSIS